MSWAFEGHIIWLMGSNHVCHHISQVAVHERRDIPTFVLVMIPEIDLSELALKISVMIYF